MDGSKAFAGYCIQAQIRGIMAVENLRENINTMDDFQIDAIDSKIICLLQKDGRMPNTEVAKKVGITEATVRNRLQRLLKNEVFQIVAVCDPFKIGFQIMGNIKINIQAEKSEHVIRELEKHQELWYIALVSGNSDLDVEFLVESLQHLKVLLHDKINKIDGVNRTETSFLLEHVKHTYEWGTGVNQKQKR